MEFIKQRKLKSIFTILTFFLSFFVYLKTVAPTVSFWDCGEFIATSYTLGVPHPPGSPLFLLIGRIFSMLPIGTDIAYRVNLMSPLVSALAVMFLFLIIAQLLKNWGKQETTAHKFIMFGGAFIGAMTFAFTDSHWFNAVEAEVYAFSTFLTSIVVWLILKWEEQSDNEGHEKYILIIAYILGLAIGIHLLNLLAIFFIALIVYFKRKTISSNWLLVLDLIIGVAIAAVMFFLFNSSITDPNKQIIPMIITLIIFIGGYLAVYNFSQRERIKEHSMNVLMSVIASLVFLAINNGVIRGIPKLADKYGIISLPIFFLIIIGAIAWTVSQKKHIISIALMSLLLILIGYSTYTTIFIRSNQNPIIDENNPETIKKAIAYLEREQYGRRSFTDIFNRKVWKPEKDKLYKGKGSFNYLWNYQIKKMYIRYFNWQFIGRKAASVDPFQFFLPLPFLLGIFGMLTHFQQDKNKALSVFALFLFTGLMIVFYLNQPDPQPRERDYSYVGSFFAFAIWIGIGAAAIIKYCAEFKVENLRKPLTYISTVLLLIALPLNVLTANYHEHNRQGNFVASDYSYNILNTCEKDAIIFTNGDNDTFPLWYLQEVEGIRKDVRVINLSLLNTDWYIKQLKDQEPIIDLGGLKDRDIDKLSVMRWEEKEVEVSAPKGSDIPTMKWKLKPTIGGMGLRVQDIMVWQLLQANKWKRPIYFAVTCSPENRIGLDKYMQMEGLGFRIHPEKVKNRIDVERMKHNVLNVYKYRNLNNPDIYYNPNIKKLVGNYRSGFFQLAISQLNSADRAEAITTLDAMEKHLPESVLPVSNDEIFLQIGLLYNEAQKHANISKDDKKEIEEEFPKPLSLDQRLEILVEKAKKTKRTNDLIKYSGIYISELNKPEKAIKILEELNEVSPNNPNTLIYLVRAYEKIEDFGNAVELLNKWLKQQPDDKQAAQMRDNYLKKLESQTASSDSI